VGASSIEGRLRLSGVSVAVIETTLQITAVSLRVLVLIKIPGKPSARLVPSAPLRKASRQICLDIVRLKKPYTKCGRCGTLRVREPNV
jgi:hypothetical protein